jgi:host factor-I protein
LSTSKGNIQGPYLQAAKDKETVVRIVMVNGKQLSGKITGFDTFTILVEISGIEVMVYKSAIAVVGPAAGTV